MKAPSLRSRAGNPESPGIRAVIGIDAAWSAKNDSGVAVAVGERGTGSRWRLLRAEASYGRFCDPGADRPAPFHAAQLLETGRELSGRDIDIIAVDMPLAHTPLLGRRVSDNAVSAAYGSRWAGTHSPSSPDMRQCSDQLRSGLAAAGYPLRTETGFDRGVIEVYPHPALIELARAEKRLPYKVGKVLNYWPRPADDAQRHQLLRAEWEKIVGLLERRIEGVADHLTVPGVDVRGRALKAFEDRLDAVVCVWVGICYLNGWTVPFGDSESAIWIPVSSLIH